MQTIRALNLSLRFALEVLGLIAMSWWGFHAADGAMAAVLGIGVPLAAAIVWGAFRVPGDPGNPPVPVSVPVRLALEAVFWAAATAALFLAGEPLLGLLYAAAVVIQNVVGFDRIRWLLTRNHP
jgi:hypothetical protein